MFKLWNRWDLPEPSVKSISVTITTKESQSLKELKQTVIGAKRVLSDLDVLHWDIAALNRFLYKFQRIFRQDKGCHYLKQMGRNLRKYLRIDLGLSFQKAINNFPSSSFLSQSMPTREWLSWLLCRIQAFVCLFLKIYVLSTNAGKYLFLRLQLGWNNIISLFGVALAARLRIIARFLALSGTAWYMAMRCHLDVLQPTTMTKLWMDPPVDLPAWLGPNWDLLNAKITPKPTASDLDIAFELINLADEDEDDVQILDVMLGHVRKGEEVKKQVLLDKFLDQTITINDDDVEEDVGEAVEIIVDDTITEAKSEDSIVDSDSDVQVTYEAYDRGLTGNKRRNKKNKKRSVLHPEKKIANRKMKRLARKSRNKQTQFNITNE